MLEWSWRLRCKVITEAAAAAVESNERNPAIRNQLVTWFSFFVVVDFEVVCNLKRRRKKRSSPAYIRRELMMLIELPNSFYSITAPSDENSEIFVEEEHARKIDNYENTHLGLLQKTCSVSH